MIPAIYRHLHTFFFFNDTATTEIYTLSLHDALPIFFLRLTVASVLGAIIGIERDLRRRPAGMRTRDRKSTRLNSSHSQISYAVFCLKKKTIRHIVNSRVPADTHQSTAPPAYTPDAHL